MCMCNSIFMIIRKLGVTAVRLAVVCYLPLALALALSLFLGWRCFAFNVPFLIY